MEMELWQHQKTVDSLTLFSKPRFALVMDRSEVRHVTDPNVHRNAEIQVWVVAALF